MNDTTLLGYLAPADHETFLSSSIAWLMDSKGTHGLGNLFLKEILAKAKVMNQLTNNIQIIPEETAGTDKRFDIAVKDNNNLIAVFEVKCKTYGSKKQLEKYKKVTNNIIRIGFDEWNFPDLNDIDRSEYCLVKYEEIGALLKKIILASNSSNQFLHEFSDHLLKEAAFFKNIKGYFIDEKSSNIPTRPTYHRYSQRFYNSLYWQWFKKRIEEEQLFRNVTWSSESQSSGVWFASSQIHIPLGDTMNISQANLNLPGDFRYWVHIELANKTGIIGPKTEIIGYIQIRFCEETPANQRSHIYGLISRAKPQLKGIGFQTAKKAPSQSNYYYSAITRKLNLNNFKYSNLINIIRILI